MKFWSIRVLFACVSFLLFAGRANAGFWEVDYDDNSHAQDAVTVAIGEGSSAGLSAIGIADSTRYWEAFLGKSFALAEGLSVTPHVGFEGQRGVSARVRFLVLSSVTLGKVRFSGLNEFAGNTGNFHKELLQLDLTDRVVVGLVNHSSAGVGPRLDFKLLPATTVYIQYLAKQGTHRFTVALTGDF